MEKIILLDTSFLIACAQFKIDYFTEIDRIITEKYCTKTIDKVNDELDRIVEEAEMKKKLAAKLAKDILAKKQVQAIKTNIKKNTDETLLEMADINTIVATIDAELKKKLKNKPSRFITIRQKKYLELF